MTLDQQIATLYKARWAAHCDIRDEREPTKERAEWWVAELSVELGIVDARGMIDVWGEVARLFTKEYKRVYKNTVRHIGVG